MDKVITIGRQYGSGGHEIGLRLAKKLGIPFYDKELLKLTAENSRFAESYLKKIDEQRPSLLGLVSGGVFSGSVSANAHSGIATQFYNMTPNDQVFLEQSKVLHSLAAKGPCVVVGRCADYILHDEGSINFFVYADLQDRVERKMALGEDKDAKAMEKRIVSADKTRAKFYEYYSHAKWGDAKNYHLCIDTSAVGIDGAVEIMASFIEHYEGHKSIMPDN